MEAEEASSRLRKTNTIHENTRNRTKRMSHYEFYLRVTRRWPIHCHNKIISEYRQHSANRTSNSAQTLDSTTRILRSQLPLIEGNKEYEEAYRTGIRNFQSYYYRSSIGQLRSFLRTGRHRRHALRNVTLVLRMAPRMLTRSAAHRLSRRGLLNSQNRLQ